MKTTSFALALAVAAALTVPAAHDVQAAYTGIQKCRAADGTAVYTDRPCDALNAAPAAMSGELGLRLASEEMQAVHAGFETHAGLADAALPAAHGTPTGRRSLAAGCARTPTQLAMDVQAAAGLGDVNRLAESYHWVGMTHQQAMPVLQRLEQMTRGRVLGAQFHGASMGLGLQFAHASGEMMEPQAGTLLLSLENDGATRTVQLNVEQYAGCYFVRF